MARAKYFDPITETWRYADEAMAGPAYTLPIASETQLGGVKIGFGLKMTDDVLSVDLPAWTGGSY